MQIFQYSILRRLPRPRPEATRTRRDKQGAQQNHTYSGSCRPKADIFQYCKYYMSRGRALNQPGAALAANAHKKKHGRKSYRPNPSCCSNLFIFEATAATRANQKRCKSRRVFIGALAGYLQALIQKPLGSQWVVTSAKTWDLRLNQKGICLNSYGIILYVRRGRIHSKVPPRRTNKKPRGRIANRCSAFGTHAAKKKQHAHTHLLDFAGVSSGGFLPKNI